LKVQPKARIDAEEASKPNRRVRRDVAPPADNIADPVPWHANGLPESVRREAKRLHILLGEDFAGMSA